MVFNKTKLDLEGSGIYFEKFADSDKFSEITENGIMYSIYPEKTGNETKVKCEAVNISGEDISPGDMKPFGKIKIKSDFPLDKVHTVCRDMLGFCGIQDLDRTWSSFGVCGLTGKEGNESLVLGFPDVSDYFYNFNVWKEDGYVFAEPVVPFELSVIKPGEKVVFSPLVILEGDFLTNLLKKYAMMVRNEMGVKKADDSSRYSGLCSWYEFYGTESGEDVKKLVKDYSKLPIGKNLDYFLIDGGWNEDIGQDEYNWGDWQTKSKFPEGMKAISDFIHENGFKSALWFSPFAVTKNSETYKKHPYWVIGKGEDLMNNGGEVYGLDLSHPEVQEYVRSHISMIFDEWGFDYIKIDFLLYGAIAGERYDNQMTSAMAFRKGMEIIRECAGERIVLNCGSPLLQSAGCCDAIRIGPDVGSHWFFPLNDQVWQYGNCCIKAGMRYTIYNNWMDGILWHNDPDCVVARSKSNGVEYQEFKKFFPGMEINEDEFGLSDSEYLAFIKLVWLTKGLFFVSDTWEFLEKRRQEMLYRFSSSHNQEVQLVDYYMHRDLNVFKTEDGNLKLGVFNIGDEAVNLSLPSDKAGIKKWKFREMTEGIEFEGEGDQVVFPQIPPRTGYIFELIL